MKRLIAMAIIAVTAIEFVSAAPEVTDITASQHFRFSIMAKKCLMSAATEIIRSCGMRGKTLGKSSASA